MGKIVVRTQPVKRFKTNLSVSCSTCNHESVTPCLEKKRVIDVVVVETPKVEKKEEVGQSRSAKKKARTSHSKLRAQLLKKSDEPASPNVSLSDFLSF